MKVLSRLLSHDLQWENKTHILKRSIVFVLRCIKAVRVHFSIEEVKGA